MSSMHASSVLSTAVVHHANAERILHMNPCRWCFKLVAGDHASRIAIYQSEVQRDWKQNIFFLMCG